MNNRATITIRGQFSEDVLGTLQAELSEALGAQVSIVVHPACVLALTLLDPGDTCPACQCLAIEHRYYPNRPNRNETK